MYIKRSVVSVFLLIILITPIFLNFNNTTAMANTGLVIDYLISYDENQNSVPQVTVSIRNINSSSIELVVSPMNIYTGQDQSLWLVDSSKITALGENDEPLTVTDEGITTEYYLEKTAQYRLIRINVEGQSSISLQYSIDRPIWTGFLETLLLRPREHDEIENGTLRFELPANWLAVTTLTKEQDGILPLGKLNNFYGDNQESIYNFVPAGFAVGEKNNIIEIETDCGRLIYAYPYDRIQTDSDSTLLGKSIFEYYCQIFGPLAPDNAYIVGMSNNEWGNIGGQPGLYPFFAQHNRTIDLSQTLPLVEYRSWEWKLCPDVTFFCDLPDYAYYGFPHKLIRAWLSSGGLLSLPQGSDWFFRGGISVYFQEMAMSSAYGQHKVYQRFQDLYQYYQDNYVLTGMDQSLFSQPTDEMTYHFISYFKSGLWAFYLNQRLLETTDGEKSIADLSRYLYEKYAGIGHSLTYDEIKDAVNVIAGTDLSDVWNRYAYGNEPLPLDPYFQDNDQDGLVNGLEAEIRTNPNSKDSDGDGVIDSVEYALECVKTSRIIDYCAEIVPVDAREALFIATPTPTTRATSTLRPTSSVAFSTTINPDVGITEESEKTNSRSLTLNSVWTIVYVGATAILITSLIIIFKKNRKNKQS